MRAGTVVPRAPLAAVMAASLMAAGLLLPSSVKIASTAELEPFARHRAMDHVRKLAGDIGVRVRATRGEKRGAAYIARTFQDLGYRVKVQTFEVDSGTSR